MVELHPDLNVLWMMICSFLSVQSVLTGEELNKLSVAGGTSLADQVALAIGQYLDTSISFKTGSNFAT